MTFWKITLSYDGTRFYGWQVQPERPTVQGVLAAALEHITGERVLPQGSGRTDAGVHALGQVASFALAAPLPQENLMRALNRSLPQSVRVLRAEIVDEGFHARHSAVRKSYEYRIFEQRVEMGPENSVAARTGAEREDEERICSPFVAPFAWDCRWPLRIEAMEKAAAMLLGTHDFTSFGASDPDLAQRDAVSAGPNPVKTIYISAVTREAMTRESKAAREVSLLRYRVMGSGFLHHMVRNIVGTLVEVGRGRLSPSDLPRILAARDRSAAGPTAPAHGLFLVQVEYGENALPSVYRSEEQP
jgi:tRNA pseudouridine38-40 synthase